MTKLNAHFPYNYILSFGIYLKGHNCVLTVKKVKTKLGTPLTNLIQIPDVKQCCIDICEGVSPPSPITCYAGFLAL